MVSPLVLACLGFLASFFIAMGILRPTGSIFSADTTESLKRTIELKLKRAGITDANPAMVIFISVATCVLVFLIILIAVGGATGLFSALAGACAVPLIGSFVFDRKARRFQDKLSHRLVPFLRKIESQVRAGQNPARAFATASQEDELLAWVLREQLQDLALQRPFNEVLHETLNVIPIRPWVQFIRSMEAFAESGGRLADILASNVERINSQMLLRQRLLGDVAQYRAQQVVIMCFAIGIPLLLFWVGGEVFGSVLSSFGGIMALIVAVLMDIGALKMTQSAIRDVERKLEA